MCQKDCIHMSPISNTDRLAEFPLFLGMSGADLDDVLATTKFGFSRYASGKTVAAEDSLCTRLLILAEGSLSVESRAYDNGYVLTERTDACDILQPECFFGLTQRYTRTFTALTECCVASLEKADVMRLTEKHVIFRLNLMNNICTSAQKAARTPWRGKPQDIRGKIFRFIEVRCMRPAGGKLLRITMERLAHEIGESRLNVSRELNALHAAGMVRLRRGEIQVPALERLIGR